MFMLHGIMSILDVILVGTIGDDGIHELSDWFIKIYGNIVVVELMALEPTSQCFAGSVCGLLFYKLTIRRLQLIDVIG